MYSIDEVSNVSNCGVSMHGKTKSRKISACIMLFRTDEIFIKFGELIPESTQDTTAAAFPKKPV